MTALALWLKSKLFGSSSGILILLLVGLVALIVLPNLDAIKERLGIETRASLKVKVQAQQTMIDTLESSNTNLADSIAVIEQINQVKEQAVTQQAEIKESVQEAVKEVIKVKRVKIKTIKASVNTNQTAEISRIQIKALWASYCDFNNHPQCGVST